MVSQGDEVLRVKALKIYGVLGRLYLTPSISLELIISRRGVYSDVSCVNNLQYAFAIQHIGILENTLV